MALIFQLESLLFAAGRPLTLKELSNLLNLDNQPIKNALEELANNYQEQGRGLRLINNGHKYQLTTAPEQAALVSRLLQEEISGELSRPSLEALTIIAYRGPIAKTEIERIRGVNCSLILRNLLLRGLIEENFNKQTQENYYQVSLDFVRHLGLNDCQQLPDFERLSSQESLEEMITRNED